MFFGSSDPQHTGTHTIAFGQASLLDSAKNAGGITSAQLVGHETLEGYKESQGMSFGDAHTFASWYFGNLDPRAGSPIVGLSSGGLVYGVRAVFGNPTAERITLQYVTPIPENDWKKGKQDGWPLYPVSVETEKQK